MRSHAEVVLEFVANHYSFCAAKPALPLENHTSKVDTGSAYDVLFLASKFHMNITSVVCASAIRPAGKEALAVELYSFGPRRDNSVAVRFATRRLKFLQVLEYTQCDGVPVRVAGGAQE